MKVDILICCGMQAHVITDKCATLAEFTSWGFTSDTSLVINKINCLNFAWNLWSQWTSTKILWICGVSRCLPTFVICGSVVYINSYTSIWNYKNSTYFGLHVTLPMCFKASVDLSPAHLLAFAQWTYGSHLVLHLPFLSIGLYTV